MAVRLALAVLLVAAISVADAALTYTGPLVFKTKDINPKHTAAMCVPASGAGCVPFTTTLTISDVTYPYYYDVKTPSGVHLAEGRLVAGSTGPITLLLPWGTYPMTFYVWGKGAPLKVAIPTTVIGFVDLTYNLPYSNAASTDAKHGVPYYEGNVDNLRWAWFALQKNNSIYTPGVAQPWYEGSATHYHLHEYWHVALDPLNKGAHENVSFCRVVLPYFADGAPDYTGTLTDEFPSRTSNNNLMVSVGDYPFYGINGTIDPAHTGNRSRCEVIPNPTPPPQPAPAPGPVPLGPIAPGNDPLNPIGADFIWTCDETHPSQYVVITGNQTVSAADYALAAASNGTNSPDDYATKVTLHYVECFGPLIPTYPAGSP